MKDTRAIGEQHQPTLRDDFSRIVARTQSTELELAKVVRDIDRLITGPKPEPGHDDPNIKDIGPQSIADCLAYYVRSIGNIDVLVDRLKLMRDELAPSSAREMGGLASPSGPAAPEPSRRY